MLTRRLLPREAGPTLTILSLTALAAVLSAFMNNVAALAILIPVALQMAGRVGLPPGRVLMPLAFGSILGGTTTLIGTPPNLIVSGLRAEAGLGHFGMFDFSPVGGVLALAGVAFIGLVGWRLVPPRKQAGVEGFDTGAYLTEVLVPEESKAAGMKLREVDAALEEADAQIIGLVRNDVRVTAPNPGRHVRGGDILIIEAEAKTLPKLLSDLGLVLGEAQQKAEKAPPAEEVDVATAQTETDADKTEEAPPPPATMSCSPNWRSCPPRGSSIGRPSTFECATVSASTCSPYRAMAGAAAHACGPTASRRATY